MSLRVERHGHLMWHQRVVLMAWDLIYIVSIDKSISFVALPFLSSNMAWSDGVVEQFEIVDLYTTEESDFKFYGPFNSLLSELFPISEHYMVSPQFKRVDGSLDFTVRFIVRRRRVPVFFIEVKTLRSLKELSTRGGADDQIRQRFREFASGVSTPTLYGLSALALSFAFTRTTRPPEASILHRP